MGADFNMMSLPAHLSKKQIDQRLAESGFGRTTDLEFIDKTFADHAKALQWLEDNCEKGGPALSVKHKTPEDGEMYLIALCSS